MSDVAKTEPPVRERTQRGFVYVQNAGFRGITAKELRLQSDWHHGIASGVLSRLHKMGQIARLTEKRDLGFVYVTAEMVMGRDTQEQGRRPGDRLRPEERALVEEHRAKPYTATVSYLDPREVQQMIAIIDRLAPKEG